MPFRYDTEEEYATGKRRNSSAASRRAEGSDTEIALGTRSLLAIFFGLVLICAIFFGLGYSVGRGSGTRAAAQPATDTANTPADSHLSKPSPDQSLTPVETPPTTVSDSGTPASNAAPAAQPSPAQPAAAPERTAQTSAPTAAAQTATLQPAAATVGTNFVVQVAAVRVPQDAQILVEALKKHGYTASVRNEPQDQLLHVQMGPYTSRADAVAMRSKLLSDGYNAVVK